MWRSRAGAPFLFLIFALSLSEAVMAARAGGLGRRSNPSAAICAAEKAARATETTLQATGANFLSSRQCEQMLITAGALAWGRQRGRAGRATAARRHDGCARERCRGGGKVKLTSGDAAMGASATSTLTLRFRKGGAGFGQRSRRGRADRRCFGDDKFKSVFVFDLRGPRVCGLVKQHSTRRHRDVAPTPQVTHLCGSQARHHDAGLDALNNSPPAGAQEAAGAYGGARGGDCELATDNKKENNPESAATGQLSNPAGAAEGQPTGARARGPRQGPNIISSRGAGDGLCRRLGLPRGS